VGEDLSEDCSDLVYRVACRGGGELQVYLAMRHIYSKEPVEPLRELLALIRQIGD